MNPNQRLNKTMPQHTIKLPGTLPIIKPAVTWEQLSHAPDTIVGLKSICQEFKPGQGRTCLFSGARGTAQSLAAQAIAGQLGKPLMHIDLAAVVSKYIGETEKNLNRVFEVAESQHAVLFFDEADALFGKRTEVKDSHDRFANIDTNYLLQRMEAFEGLVILTSNMKPAHDGAFMWRIHHVIDFPT